MQFIENIFTYMDKTLDGVFTAPLALLPNSWKSEQPFILPPDSGTDVTALPPRVIQAIEELRQGGFLYGFYDPRILEDAAQRTQANGDVIVDPDDDTLIGQMRKDEEEKREDEAELQKADEEDDEIDQAQAIAREQQLIEQERSRMHLRVQPLPAPRMDITKKDKDEDVSVLPQVRFFREQLAEERRRAREERQRKRFQPFNDDGHSAGWHGA